MGLALRLTGPTVVRVPFLVFGVQVPFPPINIVDHLICWEGLGPRVWEFELGSSNYIDFTMEIMQWMLVA